jgi:hypothetical protein
MNKRNKNYFISASLAVLLGIFLVNNIWFIYLAAIVFLSIILIRKYSAKKEADFLIKLFIVALLFRIFIVLIMRPFIILYGNGVDIFGDGLPYNVHAFFISETLKGDISGMAAQKALNNRIFELLPLTRVYTEAMQWIVPKWVGMLPSHDTYQISGYTYLLSALYYFFGFNPILGILFNCLLGVLLCLCIYSITKVMSNDVRTAMIAAGMSAFFPSLFLWSIVSEREMIIIFLNVLIVLCWVKIAAERKLFLIPVIILAIWIQYYFRPYYTLPLVIHSALIFLILLGKWAFRRKIIIPILTALIFIFALLFMEYPPKRLAGYAHYSLLTSLDRHRYQVFEKGASYRILPEQYYNSNSFDGLKALSVGDIATIYIKGMGHFIFEPLPFRIDNFLKLSSYPQALLTYFMLVFFILGLPLALRKKPLLFVILFLNLFIFSSVVALSEGNMGGLFRHRDIVMPIFIIFVSLGLAIPLRYSQKETVAEGRFIEYEAQQ